MIHFYCLHHNQKIIISNRKVKEVKAVFGYRYEVVNSVKDKESVDIIKQKLLRTYPNFLFVEFYEPERTPITDAGRKKISDSKIGLKRDAATRAKISAALKGRSNFQGKKHKDESKKLIGSHQVGNENVKDRIWVHDPRGDSEKRVKTVKEAPVGFSRGRDYYSIEPLINSNKN